MIEYTEAAMWRQMCMCRGSVVARSLIIAVPSAIVSLLLTHFHSYKMVADARSFVGMDTPQASMIWVATSAPLFTLLAFRTNQAWGRFWEGTGLLHAMRGEWFDSASCLATFTLPAKSSKPDDVDNFRHTLMRLMSLCHGSALDELKVTSCENYEVVDIRGLDDETVKILHDCKMLDFNRVEVILHMIQVLVIKAQQSGVISIPPPILSRVYQTLSRGFVNLLNARKIKEVRFPFPYAQVIAWMLLVLTVITPFMMSVLLPHRFWGTMGTFVPVFVALCMNHIAGVLEMPFGDDYNDLPLEAFQKEMNSSLLMLIHEFSDHVPQIEPDRAYSDFESLKDSLEDTRNSMLELDRQVSMKAHWSGNKPLKTSKSMFVMALADVISRPTTPSLRTPARAPAPCPDLGDEQTSENSQEMSCMVQRPPQTPTPCPDLAAPGSGVPKVPSSGVSYGFTLTGMEDEDMPTPPRATLTERATEALRRFSTIQEDHSTLQTLCQVTGGISTKHADHSMVQTVAQDTGGHVRSGPPEPGNENSEQSRRLSLEQNDSAGSDLSPESLDDMSHSNVRPPSRQRMMVSTIPDLYPRSALSDV